MNKYIFIAVVLFLIVAASLFFKKPSLEPALVDLTCYDIQRSAEVCSDIYEPVCATVNIQCVTTPCDPIEETYPNDCNACINPLVSSYRLGVCGN